MEEKRGKAEAEAEVEIKEEDEICLGRVSRFVFETSRWLTKRLEKNPLEGQGLIGRGLRHKMFVRKHELEVAGIIIPVA